MTGGNLVFTFKRSDASHAYPVAVETSSDLATWSTSYSIPNVATAGLPVTVVDNGSAPDDVTVTIPMAPNARIFARLRVDVPFTP